ncbi:MAG: MCE family protein [Mycobacteriales bacterium]
MNVPANVQRTLPKVLAAAVVALLVVSAIAIVKQMGHSRMRLTAHFGAAVGVYEGSDVRILGVPVGTITKVVPEGRTVRVEMEVDPKYAVPADAGAVVVPPSVVSDRYVQLAPVFTRGSRMRDGADIPITRTTTPVELDEIFRNVNDLNVALGPQGANSSGALSRLLKVSADNLDGQGAQIHSTIQGFSTAIQTLSNSRQDLFGTVSNLQQFTTALAKNDGSVRQFNKDMADVAEQLVGEKAELAAALRNLSIALAQVAAFVHDNKNDLTKNVAGLADVTGVLVQQRAALASFLDMAPLALDNLNLAYNPSSGTLDTRDNPGQNSPGLDQVLCQLLAQNKPLLDALHLPAPDCSSLSPAGVAALIQSVRDHLGGATLPLSLTAPALPGTSGGVSAPAAPGAVGAAPQPQDQLDPTLGGILAVKS